MKFIGIGSRILINATHIYLINREESEVKIFVGENTVSHTFDNEDEAIIEFDRLKSILKEKG